MATLFIVMQYTSYCEPEYDVRATFDTKEDAEKYVADHGGWEQKTGDCWASFPYFLVQCELNGEVINPSGEDGLKPSQEQ